MSTVTRPVLAAEDEETDRFLLSLAFEKAQLPQPLVTTRDGRECVDYLSGIGPFADRAQHPLPALLVLDLKMPRMHGFEVLEWLATRRELKEIPVVVLSSSSADSDVQKARQLGAREFFVKPVAFDALVKIVQQMQQRWLSSGK